MKNGLRTVTHLSRADVKRLGVAGLMGLGFSAAQAQAALDANIALGLTSLQTDFNSLMALVYPVAISITVALVIFGLVKMFIHRSAR